MGNVTVLLEKSAFTPELDKGSAAYIQTVYSSDALMLDGGIVEMRITRPSNNWYQNFHSLLFPPTEVRKHLIAWHAEVWTTKNKLPELKSEDPFPYTARIEFPLVHGLPAALISGMLSKALEHLRLINKHFHSDRLSAGDELLCSWGGGFKADSLDSVAGAKLNINHERAQLSFRVISTESEIANMELPVPA